jgi:hypothetical protein
MYVNQVYGKFATSELTTGRLREIDTYRQKNIHTGIVSNYQFNDSTWCIGDKSIAEYGEGNLNFLLAPLFKNINRFNNQPQICNLVLRNSFYYCPECMKYGEHMLYHQFSFLDKCMIHNVKLTNICPYCNKKLDYEIIFLNNLKAYQCKCCGNYLFNSDFSKIVDNWNKSQSEKFSTFEPFKNENIVPIIFSNKRNTSICSKNINKVLYNLFLGKSIKITQKYELKHSLNLENISVSKIMANRLNEKREIIEYAYVYALSCVYKHLKKSLKLSSKINKIDEYMSICRVRTFLNQNVIDSTISKCFNIEALVLYLWKRDLEYKQVDHNEYNLNFKGSYGYKFIPESDILVYLENIKKILPEYLSNDYKLDIVVHVAITLMLDKYRRWKSFINNQVIKYDKYELLNFFNSATMRDTDVNYNKEFLLLVDYQKQDYQLYFD